MPTYPGISTAAFRHPLDQNAEQTLRGIPGFDLLATSFLEYFYERPQHIYLTGNNIKVGPRQYGTLYGIYRECVRDLDIYPEPVLYISQDPLANAYSLGHKQPYIVINTALVDLLEEAEIRVVLAHELGHIKCEHSVLISMSLWVMGTASLIGDLTLGLGKLMTSGLIYGFYEWRRLAELSADRAALLVTDDLSPILRTMMKLAGGSQKYQNECSLQEFLRQAEEYEQLNEDNLNQVYKFLIYNGHTGTFLTHPFAVERVSYLQHWANSENYKNIRRGEYKRAGAEGSIEVKSSPGEDEIAKLRQQIADLKAEINRVKANDK
jgi:Zn-dependent protease with chaperone function